MMRVLGAVRARTIQQGIKLSAVIDLDVGIADYDAVAGRESLSSLEMKVRRLEG
ncbi:hypothetical protein P691DRAFT_808133 [Macrolepiota fuliginosa MF-IS2]|uniref:Uncharacterized protein n=1 Tax=Macrolepiota fuliginosa MF-IS2 TaxID=1400762 RepID=A0A9P5X679_9AGAR|nr:hypothetical protein P691DRAFT_808133 [Macrolepiota fuliginosa MF-IS2]